MIYSDPRLLSLGVIHGTTDRSMGNMRLPENTRALWDGLQIPAEKIARFKQIHSDRLLLVTSPAHLSDTAAPLPEADGWVVSGPGLGAAILTADCEPLIVWDAKAEVVGLSHCGWRGVLAELPAKTVAHMRQAGAKGPFSAWIGPHIQACCFEVQADVADQFPGYVLQKGGKLFLNLNRAILDQLTAQNISPQAVTMPYYCTCGDARRFFSYRRDHTKEALLTFVYRP